MRGVQQLSFNKNRERDRQRLERKLKKKWGQTAQRRFDRQVVSRTAIVHALPYRDNALLSDLGFAVAEEPRSLR